MIALFKGMVAFAIGITVIAGIGQTLVLMGIISPPAERPKATHQQKAPEELPDPAFDAAVLALRTLRASLHNPSSLTVSEVLRMDNGAICITYRAANGFNAIVVGRAVADAKHLMTSAHQDFIARWNARCGNRTGRDLTYARRAM